MYTPKVLKRPTQGLELLRIRKDARYCLFKSLFKGPVLFGKALNVILAFLFYL